MSHPNSSDCPSTPRSLRAFCNDIAENAPDSVVRGACGLSLLQVDLQQTDRSTSPRRRGRPHQQNSPRARSPPALRNASAVTNHIPRRATTQPAQNNAPTMALWQPPPPVQLPTLNVQPLQVPSLPRPPVLDHSNMVLYMLLESMNGPGANAVEAQNPSVPEASAVSHQPPLHDRARPRQPTNYINQNSIHRTAISDAAERSDRAGEEQETAAGAKTKRRAATALLSRGWDSDYSDLVDEVVEDLHGKEARRKDRTSRDLDPDYIVKERKKPARGHERPRASILKRNDEQSKNEEVEDEQLKRGNKKRVRFVDEATTAPMPPKMHLNKPDRQNGSKDQNFVATNAAKSSRGGSSAASSSTAANRLQMKPAKNTAAVKIRKAGKKRQNKVAAKKAIHKTKKNKKTAKAPAIKKTAATSDAAAQRAMNSNPTKSDITSVHKHYLAAMPSHLLAQEKAVMDLTKPFAPAGNLYVVGPKTMEASLRHPAQKAALEERLTWVLAAMEAAGSSMGRGKKKNTEQRIPGSIEFFTDISLRYLRDRLKSRIRIEVAAMK